MLLLAVSKHLVHIIGNARVLDLKSSGPKAVRVRVPPSAPFFSTTYQVCPTIGFISARTFVCFLVSICLPCGRPISIVRPLASQVACVSSALGKSLLSLGIRCLFTSCLRQPSLDVRNSSRSRDFSSSET